MWIHCLHPVLNQTLEQLDTLPARHLEDVDFEHNDGVCYFQDGTERPIQRPHDAENQKLYYSGKKNNIRVVWN